MAFCGFLKQSTAATIKLGPFVNEDDGKTAEGSLTISQADVRLSKNGGDFAQKADSNAATHDELGYYDTALGTTDTGTLGLLSVVAHESGALPVRQDYLVISAVQYDLMLFGPLPPGFIAGGTAAAGASGNIELAAATSFGDDEIIGAVVMILSGTGAGQSRYISAWNDTSKEASVSPDWDTAPSTDSVYLVAAVPPAPTASALLPAVEVASVAGQDITAQAGQNLNTFFDNGDSVSTVVQDDAASAGASAADIADAVLDEALSGHATPGTLGAAIADIDTATGNTDDAVGAMDVVVGGIAADLATVEGKIDTIDGIVDDILEDTGTTGVKVDDSTPIESNVKAINDVTLEGDGTTGTPWGPSS